MRALVALGRGRAWAFALAIALFGAAGPARAAVSGDLARREARVTYLAGATVYVDLGRADGLLEGDTLEVTRGGRSIARLRVSVLGTRRAACDTMWTRALPGIGDGVRWLGRGATPPAPPAAAPPLLEAAPDSARAAPARARRTVRGSAGLRWLAVSGGEGHAMRQPMIDLRLDAGGRGASWSAALDARGRRTVRDLGPLGTSEAEVLRVYRASLELADARATRRVVLGRQSAAMLAGVSLFDGARVQLERGRWNGGLFAGTQPEPVRMAPDGDVFEWGGWIGARAATGAANRWSTALGAVSSRAHGETNRDFVFAHGDWRGHGVAVSLLQEADANTGWKRQDGAPAFALTSTFATSRWEPHPVVALHAGYDSRRSVRLWRDRATPETEFDDRFRQGVWGGVDLAPLAHVRLSADVRALSGAGDDATSWSAGGELFGLTPLRAGVRVRASQVEAGALRHDLLTGSIECAPLPAGRLRLGLGERRSDDPFLGREEVRWWNAEADVAIGGRTFLDTSWERESGGFAAISQLSAGLRVRF